MGRGDGYELAVEVERGGSPDLLDDFDGPTLAERFSEAASLLLQDNSDAALGRLLREWRKVLLNQPRLFEQVLAAVLCPEHLNIGVDFGDRQYIFGSTKNRRDAGNVSPADRWWYAERLAERIIPELDDLLAGDAESAGSNSREFLLHDADLFAAEHAASSLERTAGWDIERFARLFGNSPFSDATITDRWRGEAVSRALLQAARGGVPYLFDSVDEKRAAVQLWVMRAVWPEPLAAWLTGAEAAETLHLEVAERLWPSAANG